MGPTKVFEAKLSNPDSIRGKYGLTDTRNVTHGSGIFLIVFVWTKSAYKQTCRHGIWNEQYGVVNWTSEEDSKSFLGCHGVK